MKLKMFIPQKLKPKTTFINKLTLVNLGPPKVEVAIIRKSDFSTEKMVDISKKIGKFASETYQNNDSLVRFPRKMY